jgi:arylsulfatase A-like enzyme
MPDQPNVIVFLTDQQRWDATGIHGNPHRLTPNFDELATAGTHFANTSTCQPLCGPARACLQTGMYATQNGVFRNHIPLAPKAKTLADYFKGAGYQTGYIGKWHLASQDPVPEHERGGYEDWIGANLFEVVSKPYHTLLYDEQDEAVVLPGYRVDALTDAAIRYLNRYKAAASPFFLFLSLLEPHHQNHLDAYVAPRGYAERYHDPWVPPDLAALRGTAYQHLPGYYGIVQRIDEALGRLLDALVSLDLLDDTILVFTSDHGCHFKTRNAEYKRSCHESSIRIPLAIHGPGFTGGGRVDRPVSLIDLPPTLLDAADIPLPDAFQGQSRMPLLRGEPDDVQVASVFVQISETQIGRAVRTRRWKYSVQSQQGNPVEDAGAAHYTESHLYDLYADPYELTNLIGMDSHRDVADWLQAQLIKHMTAAEEPTPVIEAATARSADPLLRRVDPQDYI